jgi:hypothetical protein
MMQGYEKSKIKIGDRPAVEEEREIYLPDEYLRGGAGRRPLVIRGFDPDVDGSMGEYMSYKKGGLHKAAKQVRGAGRHDDTILIHVNPDEFEQMRKAFGDPIINPETGLPEYGFFSKVKKALKKIAPILSIASLFLPIPGLNTLVSGALGKLAPTLLKAGSMANTLASGAIAGGITGGKKGAITGGLGAFASTPGVAQSLGSVVPGVQNPEIQTAIGRGIAGAGGAALTGRDPLTGALTAAGAGYGADQISNSNFVQQGLAGSPLMQQAALGAAQGMNIAGQTGGDIGRGAIAGGVLGGTMSAADEALAKFRSGQATSYGINQQDPLQRNRYFDPASGSMMPSPMAGGPSGLYNIGSPAAAPTQLAAGIAPAVSNLIDINRPEISAVISQLSQVPNKQAAVQAASMLGANPDTRPVYDAMSNFTACDNAPHFGACFAQNFGMFMNSISQNAPKLSQPVMGAKVGGLARYAEGGYVDGDPTRLAIGGPGDGQDDLIRMDLTDGDFIISADVVSALGSGSTSAGVRALESMVGSAVGDQEMGSGSDAVPALVSDGEFRVPRAAVMALGNGSIEKGSEALYKLMENVRRSYRSAGPKDIPQKSKSPLQYMKSRAK